MWIVNKSAEEQELINKAVSKALQKSKTRISEGKAVELALKDYLRG